MKFSVNHPVLFVMVALLIAVVLAQSVYFLVRAYRRALEIGMEKKKLNKTITSAALFTIAPAISILVGVVALSKSLGLPLPWLRLSIIGSLSYETIAAGNTLNELGIPMGQQIDSASAFVTVAWVMTLGIIIGLFLTPLLAKKIQKGMKKIENMDKKWSEIFTNAMFLGMISAFLGYVFWDFSSVFSGKTSALIPVLVMAASAVIMLICGLLTKVLRARWITDYALPISLVGGMALAIPITNWLG
ncbi:MAG: DUF5058 family protein [Clostridia bacterium]|nr:DUF5058 family protein [Clostridia bacterium]